jgi:hypothetical protein
VISAAPVDSSFRPVHFGGAGDDAITAYLKLMTRVCPFIEPAERAGCLYASQIALDCNTGAEIHPRMFEQLIPAIERYRERRRALPDKNHRLLLSETVFFRIPAHLEAEANRLMTWPNWLGFLVKDLYTAKAIVFGFIRKGVSERSSEGEAMPISPLHAVVIRSKVIGADHRFFAGNEAFLSALAEAVDDGGDVHCGLFPQVPDVRDPLAIRKDNYFDRLRSWAQDRIRNRPGGR